MMEGVSEESLAAYADTSFVGLNKAAIDLSDGVIQASESIDGNLAKHIQNANIPSLGYYSSEDYIEAYNNFYDEVLEPSEVLQD